MDSQYEKKVKKELRDWEAEMLAKSGIVERISRNIQKKVDAIIPAKVHNSLTKAMEIAVKSILTGMNLIPINKKKIEEAKDMTLAEVEHEVQTILNKYKKLGAAGGAGTGAGGILLMAIDYPTLISLKLKMLQEIAQSFGYNSKSPDERIFMLKVFLLAFSGDMSRRKVYIEIRDWKQESEIIKYKTYEEFVDWREFYTEYKESIEFKKLLQLLPGVGAVVGAWANYSLIDELGKVAINSYRLRYFKQRETTNA